MNPKGLASNRRMKKGGRAAVIPLGEVNPPPPEGSERVQTEIEFLFEFFELKESCQGPRSPHPPLVQFPRASKISPKIDQNFDVILVSFLAPLGSLLASLLGPHGRPNRPKFGPRGPRIAPRRPKMASRPTKMTFFHLKSCFFKNVKNPKENQ